jgi:predicted nucleic acid-binding protein
MTRYVIDSWAWVEYLEGTILGEKVRSKITDDANEVYTHVVSLAEIISKVRRKKRDAEEAWNAVITNSKMFRIGEIESKEASLLHATMKSKHPNFGLADAFVLSAARKLGGKVLTGDPGFRGLEDVVMLA